MPLYSFVILGAWLVFLAVWFVAAFAAKPSRRRGWTSLAIRVAFVILILYLVENRGFTGFNLVSETRPSPALGALGALLAVLGIALAVWARLYLGRNWGMPMSHRVEPELVTTGPYSYIRHPIYTGVLLALLGSALAAGAWWLVLFAAFTAYFVSSAVVEDRDMARQFPDTYPEYKKRTKMLIPFLV